MPGEKKDQDKYLMSGAWHHYSDPQRPSSQHGRHHRPPLVAVAVQPSKSNSNSNQNPTSPRHQPKAAQPTESHSHSQATGVSGDGSQPKVQTRPPTGYPRGGLPTIPESPRSPRVQVPASPRVGERERQQQHRERERSRSQRQTQTQVQIQQMVVGPPPIKTVSLIPSFRPPPPPQAAGTSNSKQKERELGTKEAGELCQKLVNRVWEEDMGLVWERAVEYDRRGHMGSEVHGWCLGLFYVFIPLVLLTPPADPIICRSEDLVSYEKVLKMFGIGSRALPNLRGGHRSHVWYSKPSSGKRERGVVTEVKDLGKEIGNIFKGLRRR